MSTLRKGFTLVEILIVVVILGILAAIVVPQFASASQDAIKSALQSQMQTISAQVELYRVQNAGQLPHQAVAPDTALQDGVVNGANNSGWGIMIDDQFLKDTPNNGFTGSDNVVTEAAAVGAAIANLLGDGTAPAAAGATAGWIYNTTLGTVHANGLDNASQGGPFLSTEPADADGNIYTAANVVW